MCVDFLSFLLRLGTCKPPGGLKACLVNCTAVNLDCYNSCYKHEGWAVPLTSVDKIVYPSASLVLLLLSLVISCMMSSTLGLDMTSLQAAVDGTDDAIRKQAQRVLSLRRKDSLLLTTLLVASTSVNVAFAVFLSNILGLLVGFLACTLLILIFVEILPPAICSQHALQVASGTAWLARLLLITLFPIAFPVSILLDKYLTVKDPADEEEGKKWPGVCGGRMACCRPAMSQADSPRVFVANPLALKDDVESASDGQSDEVLDSPAGDSTDGNQPFMYSDEMDSGMRLAMAGFGDRPPGSGAYGNPVKWQGEPSRFGDSGGDFSGSIARGRPGGSSWGEGPSSTSALAYLEPGVPISVITADEERPLEGPADVEEERRRRRETAYLDKARSHESARTNSPASSPGTSHTGKAVRGGSRSLSGGASASAKGKRQLQVAAHSRSSSRGSDSLPQVLRASAGTASSSFAAAASAAAAAAPREEAAAVGNSAAEPGTAEPTSATAGRSRSSFLGGRGSRSMNSASSDLLSPLSTPGGGMSPIGAGVGAVAASAAAAAAAVGGLVLLPFRGMRPSKPGAGREVAEKEGAQMEEAPARSRDPHPASHERGAVEGAVQEETEGEGEAEGEAEAEQGEQEGEEGESVVPRQEGRLTEVEEEILAPLGAPGGGGGGGGGGGRRRQPQLVRSSSAERLGGGGGGGRRSTSLSSSRSNSTSLMSPVEGRSYWIIRNNNNNSSIGGGGGGSFKEEGAREWGSVGVPSPQRDNFNGGDDMDFVGDVAAATAAAAASARKAGGGRSSGARVPHSPAREGRRSSGTEEAGATGGQQQQQPQQDAAAGGASMPVAVAVAGPASAGSNEREPWGERTLLPLPPAAAHRDVRKHERERAGAGAAAAEGRGAHGGVWGPGASGGGVAAATAAAAAASAAGAAGAGSGLGSNSGGPGVGAGAGSIGGAAAGVGARRGEVEDVDDVDDEHVEDDRDDVEEEEEGEEEDRAGQQFMGGNGGGRAGAGGSAVRAPEYEVAALNDSTERERPRRRPPPPPSPEGEGRGESISPLSAVSPGPAGFVAPPSSPFEPGGRLARSKHRRTESQDSAVSLPSPVEIMQMGQWRAAGAGGLRGAGGGAGAYGGEEREEEDLDDDGGDLYAQPAPRRARRHRLSIGSRASAGVDADADDDDDYSGGGGDVAQQRRRGAGGGGVYAGLQVGGGDDDDDEEEEEEDDGSVSMSNTTRSTPLASPMEEAPPMRFFLAPGVASARDEQAGRHHQPPGSSVGGGGEEGDGEPEDDLYPAPGSTPPGGARLAASLSGNAPLPSLGAEENPGSSSSGHPPPPPAAVVIDIPPEAEAAAAAAEASSAGEGAEKKPAGDAAAGAGGAAGAAAGGEGGKGGGGGGGPLSALAAATGALGAAGAAATGAFFGWATGRSRDSTNNVESQAGGASVAATSTGGVDVDIGPSHPPPTAQGSPSGGSLATNEAPPDAGLGANAGPGTGASTPLPGRAPNGGSRRVEISNEADTAMLDARREGGGGSGASNARSGSGGSDSRGERRGAYSLLAPAALHIDSPSMRTPARFDSPSRFGGEGGFLTPITFPPEAGRRGGTGGFSPGDSGGGGSRLGDDAAWIASLRSPGSAAAQESSPGGPRAAAAALNPRAPPPSSRLAELPTPVPASGSASGTGVGAGAIARADSAPLVGGQQLGVSAEEEQADAGQAAAGRPPGRAGRGADTKPSGGSTSSKDGGGGGGSLLGRAGSGKLREPSPGRGRGKVVRLVRRKLEGEQAVGSVLWKMEVQNPSSASSPASGSNPSPSLNPSTSASLNPNPGSRPHRNRSIGQPRSPPGSSAGEQRTANEDAVRAAASPAGEQLPGGAADQDVYTDLYDVAGPPRRGEAPSSGGATLQSPPDPPLQLRSPRQVAPGAGYDAPESHTRAGTSDARAPPVGVSEGVSPGLPLQAGQEGQEGPEEEEEEEQFGGQYSLDVPLAAAAGAEGGGGEGSGGKLERRVSLSGLLRDALQQSNSLKGLEVEVAKPKKQRQRQRQQEQEQEQGLGGQGQGLGQGQGWGGESSTSQSESESSSYVSPRRQLDEGAAPGRHRVTRVIEKLEAERLAKLAAEAADEAAGGSAEKKGSPGSFSYYKEGAQDPAASAAAAVRGGMVPLVPRMLSIEPPTPPLGRGARGSYRGGEGHYVAEEPGAAHALDEWARNLEQQMEVDEPSSYSRSDL